MRSFLIILIAVLPWSAEAEQRTYKIGHIPLTASLPVYAAVEAQCFEKQGLKVDLKPFPSSNDVAMAGLKGEVDVIGAGATNAVLDQAQALNKSAKAFLLTQYVKRTNLQSTDFLVAQPEIKSVADLKGKKVAFFPGSVSHALAKLTLPKYGLKPEDIMLVEMAPPKWAEALSNKEVDAAHIIEPAATKILKAQKYNVLIDGYWGEVQERVPVAAAWFVEDALTAEDEQKFYAAFQCGLELIAKDNALARKALVKYTGLGEDLSPEIRLLDYALSSDETAAKFAASFLKLLQENGATAYQGDPKGWLYGVK
jgi:ABC-type nitrate/sulfonate/bicarbonate transport system substrate-binding protein